MKSKTNLLLRSVSKVNKCLDLRRPTRQKLCMLAVLPVAAALLPGLAHAQTNSLIFQVTASDYNPATGALTPDVGPTGTITTPGTVSVQTNATPNNSSVLNFNGSGGFALSSAIPETSYQVTIFAVVLANTSTGAPSTIVAGARGSLQYRIDGTGSNLGEPAFLNRAEFQFGNSSVPLSTTGFSVIDATNDPTSARPNGVIFRTNGVTVGDSGGDGQNISGLTGFGAADNGGGTYNEFFNGQIAEVQVYDGALPASQVQSIEATLESNFGLTIANPNFNWNAGTGLFTVGSNWDQGIAPNATTQFATISNGGTAQIVSGNTISLAAFTVGSNTSTGVGNVTHTGGSLTIVGALTVGNAGGTGTYAFSGGTISAGSLVIGTSLAGGPASTGVVDVSGTASLTSNSGATLGYYSTGTLNISGGATVTLASDMLIGWNGSGVININGGTLNETGGYLQFGYFGATGATLNMTAGNINVSNGANDILLATFSSGTVFNLSGGTITDAGNTVAGYRGAAVINTSGTAHYSTNTLYLGIGSLGGSATLNLNGGTVTASTILSQGGGIINFNGGTIQANGNTTALIQGSSNLTVNTLGSGAAGAFIDTQSYTATVSASISGPGSVTKLGSGTLVMSGSNTYSGATNIKAGILQVHGTVITNAPNLVGNFSFEAVGTGGFTYSPNDPSWNYVSDGGTTAGAGISNGNNGFSFSGAPPDGTQAAFVQRLGAIQQSINFPGAGTYALTFYTEQRNGGNAVNQTLDVTVGSTDLTPGGFAPNASWTESSTYMITVDSSETQTLSFQGLDGFADTNSGSANDATAFVDDVVLLQYGQPVTLTGSAIPSASSVILTAGATLDLNNATQAIGSLNGPSGSFVTLGTGFTIYGTTVNGELITGGDNTNTTFAGGINGSGGVAKIGTGVQTLSGSNTYTGGTNVSGGTLIFTGTTALPLSSTVVVGPASLLVLPSQAAATSVASMNVSGNVIVHGGDIRLLTAAVQAGYAGGTWAGTTTGAINSGMAASDTSHLTALGVIQNSFNGSTGGTALYSSFEGQTVTNTDVLVKYTYYGDTDLSGSVDGTDYSRIDVGFMSQSTAHPLSGWFNGDFNYDGVVDGSDYTLIDNAFNTQGAQISAAVATATSQIAPAETSAVPEPATISILGIGAVGILGRRRRSR